MFPVLLHTDGERYAGLDRLRAQLAGHNVRSRLRRVGYELQRGGNEALVLEATADQDGVPKKSFSELGWASRYRYALSLVPPGLWHRDQV